MKTAQAGLSYCGILLFLMSAVACADPPAGAEPESTSEAASAPIADLSEIRDRAEKMPIDARRDIDKRVGITIERVNKEAAAKGQTTVAARLAAEFGMTVENLLDEKGKNGLSFGDLVVAHTLLANSKTSVTLADLVDLRSDGLGWGAIAFGLQFHLEDLEDAIKTEGRVAMGLTKADGKPAVIGK